MSPAPAPTRIVSTTSAPTRTVSSTPAPAPAVSTILVIEDYSDTRALLSGVLRYQGYKVIEAEDGLDGLLKAIESYPDLIIMDLALPKMDGIQLARRIHDEPKLARTPIFVVSAYLTEEVKTDARAAGCVEVIAKPFDADALLEKISVTLATC
ncbi:MAG: response regulator [Acidobacteriota bacterium]|nr:response regulator [Acidobacteriota bacterium]